MTTTELATRSEAIAELARVVLLSGAKTRADKVRVIEETCDGRPWLDVDRWDWGRLVSGVLRQVEQDERL